MVDEVRGDIKQNACAGSGAFAPGTGFEMGPEAVVVGLEKHDAAERSFGDELANGREIAVVAAILINGEQAMRIFCELDERFGFIQSGGERFIDNDVAAGRQARTSERVMRLVGRGDDDEPDFLNREQFFKASDDADIGIGFGSFVATALEDGGEAQSRNGANDRSVKGAAGEAKTDESDVYHFCDLSLPKIGSKSRGIAAG